MLTPQRLFRRWIKCVPILLLIWKRTTELYRWWSRQAYRRAKSRIQWVATQYVETLEPVILLSGVPIDVDEPSPTQQIVQIVDVPGPSIEATGRFIPVDEDATAARQDSQAGKYHLFRPGNDDALLTATFDVSAGKSELYGTWFGYHDRSRELPLKGLLDGVEVFDTTVDHTALSSGRVFELDSHDVQFALLAEFIVDQAGEFRLEARNAPDGWGAWSGFVLVQTPTPSSIDDANSPTPLDESSESPVYTSELVQIVDVPGPGVEATGRVIIVNEDVSIASGNNQRGEYILLRPGTRDASVKTSFGVVTSGIYELHETVFDGPDRSRHLPIEVNLDDVVVFETTVDHTIRSSGSVFDIKGRPVDFANRGEFRVEELGTLEVVISNAIDGWGSPSGYAIVRTGQLASDEGNESGMSDTNPEVPTNEHPEDTEGRIENRLNIEEQLQSAIHDGGTSLDRTSEFKSTLDSIRFLNAEGVLDSFLPPLASIEASPEQRLVAFQERERVLRAWIKDLRAVHTNWLGQTAVQQQRIDDSLELIERSQDILNRDRQHSGDDSFAVTSALHVKADRHSSSFTVNYSDVPDNGHQIQFAGKQTFALSGRNGSITIRNLPRPNNNIDYDLDLLGPDGNVIRRISRVTVYQGRIGNAGSQDRRFDIEEFRHIPELPEHHRVTDEQVAAAHADINSANRGILEAHQIIDGFTSAVGELESAIHILASKNVPYTKLYVDVDNSDNGIREFVVRVTSPLSTVIVEAPTVNGFRVNVEFPFEHIAEVRIPIPVDDYTNSFSVPINVLDEHGFPLARTEGHYIRTSPIRVEVNAQQQAWDDWDTGLLVANPLPVSAFLNQTLGPNAEVVFVSPFDDNFVSIDGQQHEQIGTADVNQIGGVPGQSVWLTIDARMPSGTYEVEVLAGPYRTARAGLALNWNRETGELSAVNAEQLLPANGTFLVDQSGTNAIERAQHLGRDLTVSFPALRDHEVRELYNEVLKRSSDLFWSESDAEDRYREVVSRSPESFDGGDFHRNFDTYTVIAGTQVKHALGTVGAFYQGTGIDEAIALFDTEYAKIPQYRYLNELHDFGIYLPSQDAIRDLAFVLAHDLIGTQLSVRNTAGEWIVKEAKRANRKEPEQDIGMCDDEACEWNARIVATQAGMFSEQFQRYEAEHGAVDRAALIESLSPEDRKKVIDEINDALLAGGSQDSRIEAWRAIHNVDVPVDDPRAGLFSSGGSNPQVGSEQSVTIAGPQSEYVVYNSRNPPRNDVEVSFALLAPWFAAVGESIDMSLTFRLDQSGDYALGIADFSGWEFGGREIAVNGVQPATGLLDPVFDITGTFPLTSGTHTITVFGVAAPKARGAVAGSFNLVRDGALVTHRFDSVLIALAQTDLPKTSDGLKYESTTDQLIAAAASLFAYDLDEGELESRLHHVGDGIATWHTIDVLQVENGNAAASAIEIVGVDGQKTLVVAFRGTRWSDTDNLPGKIWDVFKDVDNGLRNIHSHYGLFGDFIGGVESYVEHDAPSRVIVTGHSLGGAMAQLFMLDHPRDSWYVAITFGAPGAFSFDPGDARVANIVHSQDPIPLLARHRQYFLHILPRKWRILFEPGNYKRSGFDIILNVESPTVMPFAEHSMELYFDSIANSHVTSLRTLPNQQPR